MSNTSKKTTKKNSPILLDFEDNALLPELFGEHDRHLALIEEGLEVTLSSRGNRVSVEGTVEAGHLANSVLRMLYTRLKDGLPVGLGDVDGAIRLAQSNARGGSEMASGKNGYAIHTKRRTITPRSLHQSQYIEQIRDNQLVFSVGPAGTGKTYLAVAMAVAMLLDCSVERLILSRPAVEAGESIGFLPGDMREKVDPYLRPLYDALHDMLPDDQVEKLLLNGTIEVAPLGFMRGRTLSNAFIILDEAQNTTPMQMKMFLTRLGENSRMIIAGDPSQVDLPDGARSGLYDAIDILGNVDGIALVRFGESDVVRHPLVSKMVQAYNARDDRREEARKARIAAYAQEKAKSAAEDTPPTDDSAA